MNKSVLGILDSQRQAESAVDELQRRGIPVSAISVLLPTPTARVTSFTSITPRRRRARSLERAPAGSSAERSVSSPGSVRSRSRDWVHSSLLVR